MSMLICRGALRRGWWAALGLVLMALLLPPRPAHAQTPPPAFPKQIGAAISDFAMIIPEDRKRQLERRLEEVRATTGVQVAVVTLSGIPGGEAQLETYATGLFNAWGIGRKDRNDGILLLMSPLDRAARLELGRAYGQGYDVLAQDIVSRVLVPGLRDGQVADATDSAVAEISNRVALPFSEGRAPDAGEKAGRRIGGGLLPYAVPAVLALGFAAIAFRRKKRRKAGQPCPRCGTPLAILADPAGRVSADAGPAGAGRASRHVTCPQCHWSAENPDHSSLQRGDARRGRDDDRNRGGDGGGFGGGSSSGGGASGRW